VKARTKIRLHRTVLFVLLCFAGCTTRTPAPADTPKPHTIRYLALGDSYTIGQGVEPEERWPVQLVGLLEQQGTVTEELVLIAQTGWTTDDLDRGIDFEKPQGTFDLVSLLIGVNNQYQGRDIEAYRDEFRNLLARAVGYAGESPGRVVVLSIPDWGATPFAAGQDSQRIGAEIDQFNAVNRDETERAQARYVDVTAVSRQAAQDRQLIARDGLHPSAKMYLAWANLALPEVQAALAEGSP